MDFLLEFSFVLDLIDLVNLTELLQKCFLLCILQHIVVHVVSFES